MTDDLTPWQALVAEEQSEDLDVESLSPDEVLKDGSKDLYEQVRQRIVEPGGLYFLSKGIIGFYDLTERAHLALSMFYENRKIKSKLVKFPKSHLKTSIGTVANTLHVFAKLAILGEDLWPRLALGSNTKTNSKRFLRLIKQVPEGNHLFQSFLPELIPEFGNEDVWNQDEIIFPRSGGWTDPSVDTLGVGGAATSRHYTGVIEDDMLSEEDADSPTAIRKAIELHQYFTSLLVDDESWFLTNEHSWTQYDLNGHIVEKEPDTAVFSVGASRGLNYKECRHVPQDIMEMCRVWEDGNCVWPERYGPEALARRRQKAGARIYNAVYENDPFDPDVVDFKEEWLRYYEWDAKGNIRIPPTGGRDMEIIPRSSLNVVSAFDPALDKKTTSARSAHPIVGVDPQERIFLLSATAIREDPLQVLNVVFEEVIKWGVQYCGVEAVLFQKVLKDLLRVKCREWNEKHPKDPVYEGTFVDVKPPKGKNKQARVRALIGTSFEQGRVYIHRSMADFIDEYLHFPMGQTVDILDAFAYTAELWTPGADEEEIAFYNSQMHQDLTQRDAVTGY